jgi:transaldolase/glucose-6-phosphate isomerase
MGAPGLPAATERALEALVAAGHPVFRWDSPALTDLGAEMLRWEIATAVAGAVLEVDPFDEPNVSEAKAATQAVLHRFLEDGRFPERAPGATAGGLAVFAPAAAPAPAGDAAAWIPGLLAQAKPGDYFAVLAYLHLTPARERALEAIRHAGRDLAGVATTLGVGPRFLHSTGQLHKGGANNGVFLQLTTDEGDLAIPGERYGFGVLRAAQAAGDFEVLEKRGRRVLRLHLGREVDAGLESLARALASAGKG